MILRLLLGAAFAAMVPMGAGLAQSDPLEQTCRANELAMPDSCPCTIAQARKAGIAAKALRSLVRDDGHSEPVDQQIYSRFWMVKAQCMADATIANLRLPANLPGLPGQAALTLPPALPPAAAPGRVSMAVSDRLLDFKVDYDARLDAYPALIGYLQQDRDAQLAATRQRLRELGKRPSYIDRYEVEGGWQLVGEAGPLLSLSYSAQENWQGRGNSGGTRALVWDAIAGRPIHWDRVFAHGLERAARQSYCAALNRERKARGQAANGQSCPAFQDLSITLDRSAAAPVLVFHADSYIAGSNAEGPYEVRLPLAGALARQVRAPYRAGLGLRGPGPAALDPSLAQRLGRLTIGPPLWTGEYNCGTQVYRVPDKVGPVATAEQASMAQSKGELVFAAGGELGVEASFRSGLMLDGRFRDLENATRAEMIPPLFGEAFSAGELVFAFTFTDITPDNPAQGLGKGLATLTVGEAQAQFAVLVDRWC